MTRNLSQYLQVLGVATGMVASQLLLKRGMTSTGPISLSLEGVAGLIRAILSTPALIAGYLVGGVTTLVWLVVLSRLELSFAAPLVSALYFILLLLASRLFAAESVSPWRWAGTLLLVAAIFLISREG